MGAGPCCCHISTFLFRVVSCEILQVINFFRDIYKQKKPKALPFHNLNVKHKLWKQHMLEPQRCSQQNRTTGKSSSNKLISACQQLHQQQHNFSIQDTGRQFNQFSQSRILSAVTEGRLLVYCCHRQHLNNSEKPLAGMGNTSEDYCNRFYTGFSKQYCFLTKQKQFQLSITDRLKLS